MVALRVETYRVKGSNIIIRSSFYDTGERIPPTHTILPLFSFFSKESLKSFRGK